MTRTARSMARSSMAWSLSPSMAFHALSVERFTARRLCILPILYRCRKRLSPCSFTAPATACEKDFTAGVVGDDTTLLSALGICRSGGRLPLAWRAVGDLPAGGTLGIQLNMSSKVSRSTREGDLSVARGKGTATSTCCALAALAVSSLSASAAACLVDWRTAARTSGGTCSSAYSSFSTTSSLKAPACFACSRRASSLRSSLRTSLSSGFSTSSPISLSRRTGMSASAMDILRCAR
mmetsp:Transcript_22078/g.75035  ORF Transcript_22078/g.75035 Transcript_22078/m.75035 type:complete len:237 (-) Transcript_22078:1200-1910(-)